MTKDELIKSLEEYIPYNEEEQIDLSIILSLLYKEDISTRDNLTYHLTASAWIFDESFNYNLMCYHNIYNSWSWTGGHAEGKYDLYNVAIKEALEETGIKDLKPISLKPYSVEILTVLGHMKKGKYVPSHLHLNVTYAFIGKMDLPLKVKEDENKDVKWLRCCELKNKVSEKWMYEHIYRKLNNKIKNKLSKY